MIPIEIFLNVYVRYFYEISENVYTERQQNCCENDLEIYLQVIN